MADFFIDADTLDEPLEIFLTDDNDTLYWSGLLKRGEVDGREGEDTIVFNGTFDRESLDTIFFGFEHVSGSLRGTSDRDWVFLATLDGTGELTIGAGAGSDKVTGSGVNDRINGGSGDDFLTGGIGKDVLIGAEGRDTFYFNWFNTPGQHDQIKDFEVGVDTIFLSQSTFIALDPFSFELPAEAFGYGKSARTADQRVIYDPDKGSLFYDPDGVGGQAQTLIAVLSNHAMITVNDIAVGDAAEL